MNGDRERCLSGGMDGYLSKPIDPAILYAAVEDESGAVETPAGTDDASSASPVDRAQLLNRVGGDEQLLADVVQAFLADCPARLAAIKAAIDAHDAEQIRRTAHAFRGAAANLSAGALVNATRALERIGAEARLDAAEAAWRRLSVEAVYVIDDLRRLETTGETLRCAS